MPWRWPLRGSFGFIAHPPAGLAVRGHDRVDRICTKLPCAGTLVMGRRAARLGDTSRAEEVGRAVVGCRVGHGLDGTS